MDGMFQGEFMYHEDQVPSEAFSPLYKKNKIEESPSPVVTDSYSEEELFHLEMSDEGGTSSGGKKPRLDTDGGGAIAQRGPATATAGPGYVLAPQKRGSVHLVNVGGTSSFDEDSSKKRPRKTEDAHQICKQQPIDEEEGEDDDDPHMAKAAVYYCLVLEDQLISKNFYEGKNRIHPKSVSITVQHRRKLLDWLYRVNLQFGFHFDSWVLTASILDRFLSAQPIEKDVFQLAGCAAFLIAAKHEERFPPKISELVDICAKCYNKIDFLKMEQIMLLVLEWNILTPTVNILVREVSLIQNVKDFNHLFLINIIKKIIFHKNLAYMPPSKVAFSLISASGGGCYTEPEDVDKAFSYLLYLLKQDPDADDDDY